MCSNIYFNVFPSFTYHLISPQENDLKLAIVSRLLSKFIFLPFSSEIVAAKTTQ